MIFWLILKLYRIAERVAWSSMTLLLSISFAVAIAHVCGWIERFIWFVIEKEARKILNGTQVTLGSFRLDWSKLSHGGRIIFHASNVVLHTPHRQAWGWESPLIARVGQATVELNVPVTIFHAVLFKIELPIEVYSAYVADVQVFIERHEHVLNVYLLDNAAVLPTPPYLTIPPPKSISITDNASSADGDGDGNANTNKEGTDADVDATAKDGLLDESQHKQQAQQLVRDMIEAVQSLGRAARQGSLHTAVKQHGVEMAERLRDELSTRNRDTSKLQNGVAVMEQVGKVAVESLQAPKKIIPQRNVPENAPTPPRVRVGRIVLDDLRIFTRDSWIKTKNTDSIAGTTSLSTASSASSQDASLNKTDGGNWNTPIHIDSLVIRAAELCPSMSAKDDNGFPSVYQTADKVVEIIWRRLLAEMAKSNSGRLFSTAIGEVLNFIQTSPGTTATTTMASALPTPTNGTSNDHPVVVAEEPSESSTDAPMLVRPKSPTLPISSHSSPILAPSEPASSASILQDLAMDPDEVRV